MKKNVLVINEDLHISVQSNFSIDDIYNSLDNQVEIGFFFIPNIGVIHYFYKSSFQKYTKHNKTCIHPLLRSVTFPCVLALKGHLEDIVNIDNAIAYSISNYLSLPITMDPSYMISKPCRFTGNRIELTRSDNVELTQIKNTFLGEEGAILGEADIILFDSTLNTLKLQESLSSSATCILRVLDKCNLYKNKDNYFQGVFQFEVDKDVYDDKKMILWGRVAVVESLNIFPIYSKEAVQSSVRALVTDLTQQLRVDCIVMCFDNMEIYLDHQKELQGDLQLSSKHYIFSELEFWSTTPYMVYFNYNEVEKDHFISTRNSDYFFSSLYGTAEEYLEDGISSIRRILMKYNNIGGELYPLFQSLHLAAYHGDIETIKLLIDKSISLYTKNSFDLNSIQLSIINDHTNVFTYYVENDFINDIENELPSLTEFMIKHNAFNSLYYVLEQHMHILHPEQLLKIAIDYVQKDCIEVLLEQCAVIDTMDGSLLAYAKVINTPPDIIELIEEYSNIKPPEC
ncbi:hypothetical protein [Viridibacillus arvi]|uniref:hypothetical protein n=1 Tax=Viridibacillus arvi TaxID=263475 RepID=UPI0034D0121B